MRNMAQLLKDNTTSAYNDIREYVEENEHIGDMSVDEYINDMSNFELLDAYLTWNGICGYTSRIKDLVNVLMMNEESNDEEGSRI